MKSEKCFANRIIFFYSAFIPDYILHQNFLSFSRVLGIWHTAPIVIFDKLRNCYLPHFISTLPQVTLSFIVNDMIAWWKMSRDNKDHGVGFNT